MAKAIDADCLGKNDEDGAIALFLIGTIAEEAKRERESRSKFRVFRERAGVQDVNK